jgi:hypothetical protein
MWGAILIFVKLIHMHAPTLYLDNRRMWRKKYIIYMDGIHTYVCIYIKFCIASRLRARLVTLFQGLKFS